MKLLIFFSLTMLNTLEKMPTEQLLPTKLRVTVIDGLGNFVSGAQVSIYDDEKEYLASENAIATEKTDEKGRVTFKNVRNIAYFVEAKAGDRNNNVEGVKTGKLEEGKINKVNTVIE